MGCQGEPVKHRSRVTGIADAPGRHAIERHVVEHRAPALFGLSGAGRQLRRRTAGGKAQRLGEKKRESVC